MKEDVRPLIIIQENYCGSIYKKTGAGMLVVLDSHSVVRVSLLNFIEL